MTQEEALNILKTGANVFLTGEPGAGKTHTVNNFVAYLRQCGIEPAITASTGIAATHISGMTIHSWSGIGVRTSLDKYELDKIATNEYVSRRILKTHVLIVDEISMLSPAMLDMVDMVCREVKQINEAFGGIQIILVGDFFQLPPVMKKEAANKQNSFLGKTNLRTFAYESEAWKQAHIVVCYLSEQYRQDDSEFLSILSAIRTDTILDDHRRHLEARQVYIDDVPEHVTKLFSHNVDVDRINEAELDKLAGESRTFVMSGNGSERVVENLKKSCLSPENLELKIGAVVMCTKNSPKGKFANGTLGTVVGFDEFTGSPIIETISGETVTVEPAEWIVEENGKIRGQIKQVPLRLAWAITVHKSQGMSLDAAIMDLSQVFEFGQGYVALSRVRRLSGLYLLGMNEQALKVHPEILVKDKEFKRQSEEAIKVFGRLTPQELKQMHENFVLACGGEIKEEKDEALAEPPKPFEKLRVKYPNAYRPWKKEDDEELARLFALGATDNDLMERFGRQKGGITARLLKLGLIKE